MKKAKRWVIKSERGSVTINNTIDHIIVGTILRAIRLNSLTLLKLLLTPILLKISSVSYQVFIIDRNLRSGKYLGKSGYFTRLLLYLMPYSHTCQLHMPNLALLLFVYTRGGPCQHEFMCGCKQWSNDINESN